MRLESLTDLLHGTLEVKGEVKVEVPISFQVQWKPLQSFKSKQGMIQFLFQKYYCAYVVAVTHKLAE